MENTNTQQGEQALQGAAAQTQENAASDAPASSANPPEGVNDPPKQLTFVERFNPARALELSDAEIAMMQHFTLEQLEQLAREYPNRGTGRPYLLLWDKRKDPNKQLFARSTWQNLHHLHRMGLKHFVAYNFVVRKGAAKPQTPTAPVQDLTREEARTELAKVAAMQTATTGFNSVNVGAPQTAESADLPPTRANKLARSGSPRAAGLPKKSAVKKAVKKNK